MKDVNMFLSVNITSFSALDVGFLYQLQPRNPRIPSTGFMLIVELYGGMNSLSISQSLSIYTFFEVVVFVDLNI